MTTDKRRIFNLDMPPEDARDRIWAALRYASCTSGEAQIRPGLNLSGGWQGSVLSVPVLNKTGGRWSGLRTTLIFKVAPLSRGRTEVCLDYDSADAPGDPVEALVDETLTRIRGDVSVFEDPERPHWATYEGEAAQEGGVEFGDGAQVWVGGDIVGRDKVVTSSTEDKQVSGKPRGLGIGAIGVVLRVVSSAILAVTVNLATSYLQEQHQLVSDEVRFVTVAVVFIVSLGVLIVVGLRAQTLD